VQLRTELILFVNLAMGPGRGLEPGAAFCIAVFNSGRSVFVVFQTISSFHTISPFSTHESLSVVLT
jgi:hypothetical protein